jgi:ribosomal protein S18 acetylase RimI-like enzyme
MTSSIRGRTAADTTASGAGIAIRRAGPQDLDALAVLFDAYRGFYGQSSDVARARDWLRTRMRVGESVVLLAEGANGILGFTQLYPMFSSVRTARTWILNDLYVAESARRTGVARALLDAAADFARADGAAGLSLETTRDNTAARALYRAAGWQEDDTQWYSRALG